MKNKLLLFVVTIIIIAGIVIFFLLGRKEASFELEDDYVITYSYGDGYGTYINKRLDVINNFNIVAVAKVEEAIFLRELGYEKDILDIIIH